MLIRHSVLYIVAKLLPGLFGMATTALLTRLLLPSQYGLYGLALVIMTFGSTIGFDWLGLAYLRLGQSRADRTATEGTFLAMFLALVLGTLVLAALAMVTGIVRPDERAVWCAGLLMMWSYAWFEFATRFHVADLRPGIYLRMNAGRSVLILLISSGVAFLTRDPVWVAYGTAAATLAGAFLGGMPAQGVAWDRALARGVLLFGLPLAASLALNSVVGSGTRALVGWLGGIEALGLYTAAFVLVQNTLTVISAGLSSAGFSLAVRAVDSGNAEAARRQLLANGSLLLAVLAPASVGMALASEAIATTLVGPRYSQAVAILTPWMAAGAFLAGFRAHFLDHAFHLGKRMSGQVWVTAGSAIVTTGLAFMLIPRWGPLGAAIAVVSGAATSLVHAIIAGRSAYRLPLPWRSAPLVAMACLAMAGCVVMMPSAGAVGLVSRVVVGVASYGAACLALDVLGLRRAVLQRVWAA